MAARSDFSTTPPVADLLKRKLIFVSGKGGVGKTAVSQAIAAGLAAQGKRTLWTTFEDPTRPAGELEAKGRNLWHLNCEAAQAFEEYASMKIRVPGLAKIFLQNKLMRYLAKAAPGVHELVLLGKVWFERLNYDHVVVDMPSTGYGLAMFQSTANFAQAFSGGPLHRDADDMLATFHDARESGHLIVALPEEMPLQESLELEEYLRKYFPKNPAAFLVNRKFPAVTPASDREFEGDSSKWESPLARDAEDYSHKRSTLEEHNLRLWRDLRIPFDVLEYMPPPPDNAPSTVASGLLAQMKQKGWLAS